jgi:hypothetical protein
MGDFYRNLFKSNVDFASNREVKTKEDEEKGTSNNANNGTASAKGEIEQPSVAHSSPKEDMDAVPSAHQEPVIDTLEPITEDKRRETEAPAPGMPPERTAVGVGDDNNGNDQGSIQKEQEREDAASKAERLKREREKKAREAKERYLARKRKISAAGL